MLNRIQVFFAICLLGSSSLFAQLQIDSVAHFTYPSTISFNDIWGYTDANGTEYALVGTRTGLSVVSLADTNNLVEVFNENTTYSVWRDIKTWGDFAYVTNESSGGLAIYDLSTLPDSVSGVTSFTGNNFAVNSAHNIFVDENGVGYLFGTNNSTGSFGTIMLDLATTPGQPIELGYFDSLYLHDGYARGDTLYGSAVYDGLMVIIDVSDKTSPQIIGSTTTPSNFTHNAWLSDDGTHIFTTDEVVGGYVGAYDISDPNNIFQKDRMRSQNSTGIIPHNTHVLNDYLVTSYYTLGVSIVDAKRPSNLIEIGHFDTSPAYSGGTFNGNWGAYPYFNSGLLILSDMENGLYVVRPKYKRASYLEGRITNCSGVAIPQAKIQILNTPANETANLFGDYKTGYAFSGYYRVQVTRAGFGTRVIDSVLLSPGVVTNLDVKMIQNINGLVINFKDPLGVDIPNVEISAKNTDSTYIGVSDSTGNVNFTEIPFGKYTLDFGVWGHAYICTDSIDYDCQTTSKSIVLQEAYQDNFELDFGWSKSANSQNELWVRGVPVGSIHNGNQSNPASDHTDCGNMAYYTGSIASTHLGDVDGKSSLISPAMDLSSYIDPYINFYAWFYNGGNMVNDYLLIQGEDKNGNLVTWDTIRSNGTSQWSFMSYRLSDVQQIANFEKLRLVAEDFAPDHIVEAAMDQFFISEGRPFVGLESKEENEGFKVYPNPFNEQLIVQLEEKVENGQIRIYNSSMQLVKELNLNGKRLEINSSELNAGIYFVQIQANDKTHLLKTVIKQ